MRKARVSDLIRISACVMSVLVVVIMLFSVLYIASEADHDCMGENCPICANLAQFENIIHQAGDDISLQAAAGTVIIIGFVPAIILFSEFHTDTPVSRKVRLND
ncbi:MAG: hypothetical protein K6F52_00270 [Clostridia bacterium]|nr:hypothetical protein [Clostridia bacterium]